LDHIQHHDVVEAVMTCTNTMLGELPKVDVGEKADSSVTQEQMAKILYGNLHFNYCNFHAYMHVILNICIICGFISLVQVS